MTVTTVAAQRPVSQLIRGLTRRVPGRRAAGGQSYRADGWRVYLLHTKTGQKGAQLHPESGSWEITLNGTESLSATVTRQDLAGIERRWYTPWWGGLLFAWSRNGHETPIVAGPITGWTNITKDSLSLEARGPRAILEHVVIGTNLQVYNASLGHIMWLLVDQARLKPGGAPFPVVDATPDPQGRGHQRNYMQWDVANAQVDKRMTELSEVRNGPDVMLRPQWADNTEGFVQWGVAHGNSASPYIPFGATHTFDTTAARSGVGDLTVSTDARPMVSRVWATGAGEGEGTLITRAENFSLLDAGFPFMETVLTRSSVTADDATGSSGSTARRFPVALSLPNGYVAAPRKATVRIPLALRTSVRRWRLHIENRNPHVSGGAGRTTHVKFGDLYSGANWNNGGMGSPEKVVDIRDISAGSSETVTDWTDRAIEENIVLSFDYETTADPHACYGGGWVRKDVRDAARQGYLGMRKTTAIPFHCWLEVEVEGGTQAVAMLGSSSASGFGANLPLFDSPLSWFARQNGVIPVHYATPGDTLDAWTNASAYKWTMYRGDSLSKADKLLMYMGSNDVFKGASLEALKQRFNIVTDLAVRRLADEIHAVTIPPRTNATGAAEDVRRAFNEWLPNADLTRDTWDFASSVSEDDETLLPQYDSDGMHLNAAGYKANAEALAGLVPVADGTPVGMRLESKELRDLAEGELAARIDATDQVTFTVPADHPQYGVDSLLVGDQAIIVLEGILSIPDGPHQTRVIKMSGGLDNTVTVDLQTETWV